MPSVRIDSALDDSPAAQDRRIEGWLLIYQEAVADHDTETACEAAKQLDIALRAPVWPA